MRQLEADRTIAEENVHRMSSRGCVVILKKVCDIVRSRHGLQEDNAEFVSRR